MDYRKILSGQRRDPLAFCLRGLLRLGEIPYRLAVAYRNRSFESGRRDVHRCDVPVISIGNLTTGGTGKTPLVCFVAKYLRSQNIRVAIISRGYGAEVGAENDEAMELARSLPDVPHVQDADRVEAARIAVEELESECLLMDDGFQHRRLHRDLDIVVIDATNPFGYDHLLPRGLLREPIASIARADGVILSRADLIDGEAREKIWNVVRQNAPDAFWVEAIHAPRTLLAWPDREAPVSSLAGKNVVLVSAIGNPDAFTTTIKRAGANVLAVKVLPDHDRYTKETVESLRHWLKSMDDPTIELICTHKDLVKLQTDRLAGHEVKALLVELKMVVGEQPFIDAIDALITKHPRD
jgi:tetraacyldisaccharide 4'-kinase